MEKITKSSDKVLIDPNEPLILPDGTALVGRLEWFLYALCCLDYQNLPTPMSRIEEFANALITGEVPNIEPQSRAEQFFLAILDGNVSDLPQPQSRSEVLLDKLARGEFDLSDVEPIQSRYELLLAYLIKNGGIGNIDYVLYEFSEAMKTMYNTVEKPFKSLELSGNTLVNCVLEDTENDDYTSFDKDYSETSFTINGTSEGAIKSAILKGQTLVNNRGNTVSSIGWSTTDGIEYIVKGTNSFLNFECTLLPNTKYLTFFEFDGRGASVQFGTRPANGSWDSAHMATTDGICKKVITTGSDSKWLSFIVPNTSPMTDYVKISRIMIIPYQDGMENWDIPYFEGMQSVKMPVLTTVGKNLFDGKLKVGNVQSNDGAINQYTNHMRTTDFIKINANKTITISKLNNSNIDFRVEKVAYYDTNKNFIGVNGELFMFPKSVTPPMGVAYIRVVFCKGRWDTTATEEDFKTLQVQIEEGSTATTYEPYKTNILTTTSKNLFDMNRPYDAITDSQATVVQDTNQITVSSSAESGIYVNANFILDKDFFAGKTVTGSCLYESDTKDIGMVQISYQDGNGEHHYQWIRTPRTFTFPNSFIGDVMLSVSANNTGTPQSNTVTVKNIQLELGSTATSYEPYSEGVTLRGIGDVKDTLDCLTGQVTERIGEIVLDGSEGVWTKHTGLSTDEYDVYWTSNSFIPSNGKKAICDKLSYSNPTTANTFRVNDSGGVFIGVSKGVNITNYLSQNTPKINYNLSQESVKTVDLNVVDQNNIKIDKIHVFNETTHVNASSDELTPTVNIGKSVSYPTIIKPNTKYTVDLKRNDKPLTVNLGGTKVTFVDGETRKTITTPSTLTNDKLSYYGVGAKCNEIMLIEGEVEGNVDYFTGMQSVVMQNQMPILTTTGKNLFGGELEIGSLSSTGIPVNDDNRKRSKDFFPFNGDIAYTITNVEQLYFYDENKNFISRSANKADVSPTNTCFIKVRTTGSTEVQIEKGSIATSYEPYKTSILSCNEEVTLRGIGDVQDTLDCLTGEVIQNICEFVLDGSQDIDNDGNLLYYYLPLGVNNNRSNSDKLPSITVGQILDGLIGVAPQNRGNASRVYINVNGIATKEEMKNFFLNNPTTIQCVLTEKSARTVDLNVVDQDGNTIPKIKSYKDVTHLEVTVPKQSLLPNISAEVATDNSKDMSSLATKHQEISETQSAIQDSIQSQSDEIDTALMATTEIFESILQ